MHIYIYSHKHMHIWHCLFSLNTTVFSNEWLFLHSLYQHSSWNRAFKKHAYCYTKKQYTYHQESFKTDGLFVKVTGSTCFAAAINKLLFLTFLLSNYLQKKYCDYQIPSLLSLKFCSLIHKCTKQNTHFMANTWFCNFFPI